MNEIFGLSNKMKIVMVTFLLILVLFLVFITKNFFKHTREICSLKHTAVYGLLNTLENRNRGSYDLKIGQIEIKSLPIGFEVNKYNIEVGDSVSKEKESAVLHFYKKENGIFKKYCEYEI